jgi:hypothetical protein
VTITHAAKERKFGNRSLLRNTVATAIVGCFLLLGSGCAQAERTDPMVAFNEIAQRALQSDAAYVRDHLSASFVKQAKAQGDDVESEAFLRELMAALQVCRATACQESEDPDQVVIEAASVRRGKLRPFLYHMAFHGKHGWQLASKGQEQQPPAKSDQ